MEVRQSACDIFENKCRLCGGTAKRKKNNFLNDAGKSLELKRILRDKTAGPMQYYKN